MTSDKTETVEIALIGMGTVGTAVARVLLQEPHRMDRRSGSTLHLKRIVVNDIGKARNVEVPAGLITDRIDDVLEDPDITLAIQLIGGLSPAKELMMALLDAGKDIVTANKALLADEGMELFSHARQRGRTIAFEGAVAGGIPIVNAMLQGLAANEITQFSAILNGTSNFILTEMAVCEQEYAAVLKRAQDEGYAEADPALDINGTDAAQKLGILSQLAFGIKWNSEVIFRQGIESIELTDLQFADEFGYTVKSLAVARRSASSSGGPSQVLELYVAPTLVPHNNPLARVSGAYNAVRVEGDLVGDTLYYGQGAGAKPTASAVLADVIETVTGRAGVTFPQLLCTEYGENVLLLNPEQSRSRFYFRFMVEDRPGVLGDIAGVLGEHDISIASVIQPEFCGPSRNQAVPLVIMTHIVRTGDVMEALKRIDQLAVIHEPSRSMRVM